ncbi:hypothetical protein [Cohnella faecalis]|nr:hypothetical protein [Cohnella faecalis]
MDYTQTLNFFLAAMPSSITTVVELAQFKDKYDSGEIGYFFIPEWPSRE